MRDAGEPFDQTRAALDALHDAATATADAATRETVTSLDRSRRQLVGAGGLLAAVVLLGTGTLALRVRGEQSAHDADQRIRQRKLEREDLDVRLGRGLELASTEEAAFRVVEGALAEAAGSTRRELLVATGVRAPFHRVVAGADAPGCGVGTPDRCPAARRGQTLRFPSSGAVDVCPRLKGRPEGACSATCVPVSVGGSAVGVIHAVGPDGDPPGGDVVADLEVIARRVGEHLTMLRAFAPERSPDRFDPHTGLLALPGLREHARHLDEDGGTYTIACGGIEPWPLVGDDRPELDGGTRPLRLLSAVLRSSLRPTDLVAHHGGGRFVVVLPGCGADEAGRAMERVRERLVVALTTVGDAPASLSLGLATSGEGKGFDAVVEAAEELRRATALTRPGPAGGPG